MIDKLKYHAPAIIVIVASLAFGGLLFYSANKPSGTANPEIKISDANNGEQSKSQATPNDYSYTAQPGDSYTLLARKAVQSYTKTLSMNIPKARIIAAETILTQNAGSPELEVGQKVTLKKSDISKAVQKTKTLSPEELAAWETYVPYVQF